jgi:hypothetical protein
MSVVILLSYLSNGVRQTSAGLRLAIRKFISGLFAIATNSAKLRLTIRKFINRSFSERMVQYQLGCEIYRLKRLCKTKKHFEIVVKESLKYSCSYAYFLMKLYEACNKFVNLRFTTISVNKLMRDFSNLVELMEQDLAFWSPPSNISTPTGSCIN